MLQSHFQRFYQGNPSIKAAIASGHWYTLFLFDLQRHCSRSRSRASQSRHSRIAHASAALSANYIIHHSAKPQVGAASSSKLKKLYVKKKEIQLK
jgi:hypothetical protein